MAGERKYFVYIITNFENTVLYIGVTNNIAKRIDEHKTGAYKSFSSKYKLTKLVYYEAYDYINDAIFREKQIKGGSRKKKEDLINSLNPIWEDLFESLF